MLRACFFILSTLFVITLGCGPAGPKTARVNGVLLQDDKPVQGASVTFMSTEGNRVATGETDGEGKFTLRTVIGSQMIDGAVPGTHKIGIAKTTSSGGASRQEGESDRDMVARMAGATTDTSKIKQTYLIPAKYNNPESSGLTATVSESGPNEIELKISSK